MNAGGNLVPNGHTLTINGAFSTVGGNGQLTMTNAADVVNVTGNVTFGSTNTGGSMTAGTLNIGGNFLQQGSPQSITAGGNNALVFNGTGTQTVIFPADGNFANGACVGTAGGPDGEQDRRKPEHPHDDQGSGEFPQQQHDAGSDAGIEWRVHRRRQRVVRAERQLFHVGVGGTTFSKGAGTTIDSVTCSAPVKRSLRDARKNYADIRGTSSWTAPGTLTGQMFVDGNGQLNVATSAVVTGNFTTSGSGTLKMT